MEKNKSLKICYNKSHLHDIGLTEIEIIPNNVESLDNRLFEIESEIEGLHSKYDKLENHATKLDYAVAVSSGFIASLIDILFVKTFDFQVGKEWSDTNVEDCMMSIAKKTGYKGDDPKGAIRHLESKYKSPSDSVYNTFGGSKQHHLRDFAHHASLIGLFFSMLTQFTGKAYGTTKEGCFVRPAPDVPQELIGKDLPRKIEIGLVHWILHLASDVAGSSSATGIGTGIPGPILSLVKLLSTIPVFKNKDGVHQLSLLCSKLFNGTLLGERDENGKIVKPNPLDIRGAGAVLHQLSKQLIPVIINEALVRGFYSISRLINELKEKKEIKKINWKRILPTEKENGTLTRMLTISTGVFTAIDQVDAIVEGAINSKGSWAEFGRQVLMRVNFVGLGRFTVSLGSETILLFKKSKNKKEEMKLLVEALYLNETKLYYGEKLYWTAIKDLEISLKNLYNTFDEISKQIMEDRISISNDIDKIKNIEFDEIEENNPGLLDEILEELRG